ncbi:MAG: hypothetical protein FWD60_06510 [Candidatus Azobacteroides sp.]|nr:hypothetical protein [Candidatus Azobacteroides sp.]
METNEAMNRTNAPDTKEKYEAPVMEIVEIKVEQGFQMSGGDPLKEQVL